MEAPVCSAHRRLPLFEQEHLVAPEASNYDMQALGRAAIDSVFAEYAGGIPSLEAAYRVGSTVLHELLKNWGKWESTIRRPAMKRSRLSRLRHTVCVSAMVVGFSGVAGYTQSSHWFETIKKSATKEQLYSFLYALPKGGDLHNHNVFSYLAEMWYDGATDPRRKGNEFYTRIKINNCSDSTEPLILFRTIQRSTYGKLSDCRKGEYHPLAQLSPELKQRWLSAMKLDEKGEGRNEFFEVIGQRLNELFRDPNLVADLLVENMKRFGAEGLRYLETQVGAANFLDEAGNPIDVEKGVQLLRDRLNQPDARNSGVTVRFQSAILRFSPVAEENLERVFDFVDKHRDLWVGINMAGREDNDKGHALRFLDTYRKMRRKYSGIGLSIHGGEVDAPGTQVRDTLLLGATRIGHGVNLITDPDTMLLMRNGKFLVEINLISNRLLEYYPDLTLHPFPEFLRIGIPVNLNTDDRGVWDSNMTDEYYTAVTLFNLTWDEIVEMGRNSLTFSFVEPTLKARLLEEYEASISAFEKKYSTGNWAQQLSSAKPSSSGYAARTFGIHLGMH